MLRRSRLAKPAKFLIMLMLLCRHINSSNEAVKLQRKSGIAPCGSSSRRRRGTTVSRSVPAIMPRHFSILYDDSDATARRLPPISGKCVISRHAHAGSQWRYVKMWLRAKRLPDRAAPVTLCLRR